MLERLFKRKDQNNKGSGPESKPKPNDYNIQPGHAYILLGGKEDDIAPSCPACGGPFKGPCQSACEHCTTSRKVFYADITDSEIVANLAGKEVKDLSFVIPDGESVEFGYHAVVDTVIAEEVSADETLRAKLVVAKKFRAGFNSCIQTLILVDGGIAEFDDESRVINLITGKNTSVRFGFHGLVDNLLKISTLSIKADDEFEIQKTQLINPSNFTKAVADALQNR